MLLLSILLVISWLWLAQFADSYVNPHVHMQKSWCCIYLSKRMKYPESYVLTEEKASRILCHRPGSVPNDSLLFDQDTRQWILEHPTNRSNHTTITQSWIDNWIIRIICYNSFTWNPGLFGESPLTIPVRENSEVFAVPELPGLVPSGNLTVRSWKWP